MTDLRQAAEMALKALEEWRNHDTVEAMHIFETITVPETLQALRQALADPISMTASELADRIKRGEKWKIAEPDMGIDRGAWDDVPDATKWVDELRGGEDLDEPPNSTTGMVAELRSQSYELIDKFLRNNLDDEWYPTYSNALDRIYHAPYTPDLLNQTCCECGRSGGYALYCGDCWGKNK